MARVTAAAAVLLALLATLAPAGARDMLQRAETNCQVASSTTLNLAGSGSGGATGMSLCEARAEAENVVEKVVSDWCDVIISKGEGCTRVEVENVVQAVAEAYASVLGVVRVEAEVTGTGEACASGRAEGDAVATALLDVAIETTVSAVKEKHGKKVSKALKKGIEKRVSEGEATAGGRAISVVVAEAWAKAYDALCTMGAAQASEDEGFAEQITKAYAELWAYVAIQLCEEAGLDTEELKEWQKSQAKSDSLTQGSVDTTSTNMTRGDAGVGEMPEPGQCIGEYEVCCATEDVKCDCGNGCTAIRNSVSEDVVTWVSPSGRCFCF